jgi:hypothetical protein
LAELEVGTPDGVYVVELESEEVIGFREGAVLTVPTERTELPRAVAAARSGSTVVVVVDRRPPLAVSHDAGQTWREAGGGLPAGNAVAIADDPDLIAFAGRNRIFVSHDGGRFWQALTIELPEIQALRFGER